MNIAHWYISKTCSSPPVFLPHLENAYPEYNLPSVRYKPNANPTPRIANRNNKSISSKKQLLPSCLASTSTSTSTSLSPAFPLPPRLGISSHLPIIRRRPWPHNRSDSIDPHRVPDRLPRETAVNVRVNVPFVGGGLRAVADGAVPCLSCCSYCCCWCCCCC